MNNEKGAEIKRDIVSLRDGITESLRRFLSASIQHEVNVAKSSPLMPMKV